MAKFTRFPVVSLGAEYLVMGYLLRRNILTYKAPPNNEGYDLVCMHPDPRKVGKQIRVQVKSRFATDCNRGFMVRSKSFDAFDYLVVAFMNIGYYLYMRRRHPVRDGLREPEFFTLPNSFIRKHHKSSGGWEKVETRGIDLEPFRGDRGFDLIAKKLRIGYPDKESIEM